MILRPVRPQSPSGPPTTKLPVGLTRKSDGLAAASSPSAAPTRTAARDHLLDQAGRVFLVVAALLVVLGRDHDLGAADRLAVDVFHRDLALGVGLQVGELAVARASRQHLQDLVREEDRRRHVGALLVDFALVAGVAEHHALVARALFLAALLFLGIDAHARCRATGRAAAPRCRRRDRRSRSGRSRCP